ncbi:phosphoenolpyruvate hydrolase family protein [Clostridium sp. CM028]|uniref:phosphoenolpyruvate hydrolase family protein n=1 Tax=unclassified Clostridium TaxID=2614128 RepID=UPI001C0C3D6C|nr:MULTISPECIES: phosphoenolpyruvate hydrolase family protein [unclassified Clostridium]MBU3093294.1 phosphoenolpyruvate hydrolase family protein [Clostridium sp. CF011]MBW9146703.1 phosphoenolpyruvate hydrolase family protein [Clostridium sp. CM027]MBW9148155.1 phosphoenolpyruvate hydrolase family protein [Clostridium sp. CM028]UVE42613.1 phosphoenolpyruvate hydrolase family protein [Clostridium sp. CM027]WAG70629.1 phosphoenolpyruvate hydrolase family protein [Clostridium sp. CF011]
MKREKILENLKLQIKMGNHIIGVAAGAGITATYAKQGGADFLLMLNSGRFRQMGRGSLAGFLPFCNSNDMVMDFASKEIMPLVTDIPIIFGLNATDPTKNINSYIDEIRGMGFSGINNYPTVGLIDGQFSEALKDNGQHYLIEVQAIRIAHEKDMFTVAFVFDEVQTAQMIDAGADIICAHLGLTGGGLLGAKKVFSLEAAKVKVDKIFNKCNELKPEVIKLVYGGPVKTPIDIQYMYSSNKSLMGYIGGSAFERIPSEKAITNITKAFKIAGQLNEEDLMIKMLDGVSKHYDYVGFVQEYVSENYMNDISFLDLATVAHVSRSYLSSLFKKKIGCSFPQYIVKFRINKAVEILERENIQLSELASLVGYHDYSQFSKMFKKYKGLSPKQYKAKNNT